MKYTFNHYPLSTSANLSFFTGASCSDQSWMGRIWRRCVPQCTVGKIVKITLLAGVALASLWSFYRPQSQGLLSAPVLDHNTPNGMREAWPYSIPLDMPLSPVINAHANFTTIDARVAQYIKHYEQQAHHLKAFVAKILSDGGKIVNGTGAGFEGVGTSGIYFIKDKVGKTIALFKPEDEGTWKPNNPNPEFRKRALTADDIYFHQANGWEQGQTGKRQQLAEMLHIGHKVRPPRGVLTTLESDQFFDHQLHAQGEKCSLTKTGYLQEWVHHTKPLISFHPTFKEVLPSDDPHRNVLQFQDNPILSAISLDEFQEIGINDILLLNEDRNTGNLLVKYDENHQLKIIPIDHDTIYPWKLEVFRGIYVHDNAKKPFTATSLKMIQALDPDFIEQLVEKMQLSEQAPINAKAITMVLKSFAAAGATLRDVYNFMAAPLGGVVGETSQLWKLMQQVQEAAISSLPKEDKMMYAYAKHLRRNNWCKAVNQTWCKTMPSQQEKSAADWYQSYKSKHADRIEFQIKTAFWKEFEQQLAHVVNTTLCGRK